MQIGVCDDQKEIRDMLMEKIKKFSPVGEVVSYDSGQAVLDASQLPDILFLDIQMPQMDGMETARKLRMKNQHIILIFVTVTQDYVFQSFDVGAFHYLLKPFEDAKFQEVLQNAVRQYEESETLYADTIKQRNPLMVTVKGEHITIPMEDIVYAEIYNRKIIIHTMDADIEYYGKMKDLEQKAGDEFYRPHRAYLVNFKYVRRYDAATIYLKKGQALMAKQNYREFVKRYLRYVQKKEKH